MVDGVIQAGLSHVPTLYLLWQLPSRPLSPTWSGVILGGEARRAGAQV